MTLSEIMLLILSIMGFYLALAVAWILILILIAFGIYKGYELGCEIIDWLKER